MIAAARVADITIVIVEKMDRLARELVVQEKILAHLKARGMTLVSVAEPDLCSYSARKPLLRCSARHGRTY